MSKNIDHIQSIRDLRFILKSWTDDEIYMLNGGKIYYAIDSDIIKMYSNPDEVYKYVKVLSTDDPESLKLLSRSLSNFMFNESRYKFLSVKPHYAEMFRILYAILSASPTGINLCLKQIEKIKNQLNNAGSDIENVYDLLEKNTEILIRYLMGEEIGSIAEIEKINNLLSESKVISICDYEESVGEGKWAFPELYDELNITDKQKLIDGCDKWFKLLISYAPEDKVEKYRYNVFVDSEVLTRIEYINQEIQSTNRKLVLITGDSKIHRAAKRENFEYVRDPKMFFASPSFFRIDKKTFKNQNRLLDWIETSLLGVNEKKDNREIEKFVIQNKKIIITNIQEFKATWDRYVRRNLLDYGFRTNKKKKVMDFIVNHSFDEISDLINKKVISSWYDTWMLSLRFGTWAIAHLEENKPEIGNLLPKRGLPALKLTFCATNIKLEQLYKTLSHRELLDNMKTFIELTKEDKSDYGAFLLYALAFGSAGKWGVSYILAKIALNLAENISVENQVEDEQITGNEAAYLCAWSSRQCSENRDMLTLSRKYILIAQKKKFIATGSAYDLRYECEDNAITIAYSMYNIFFDNNPNTDEQCFSIMNCRDRLKKIIIEEQNTDRSDYESLMIKRQSFTYYYISNILILYMFNKAINDEEKIFAQHNMPLYRNVLNNAVYPIRTCINKIIYMVSSLVFNVVENKEKLISEIKDDFVLERIKRCDVSPYDKKLYKFLYTVAERFF